MTRKDTFSPHSHTNGTIYTAIGPLRPNALAAAMISEIDIWHAAHLMIRLPAQELFQPGSVRSILNWRTSQWHAPGTNILF